MRLRDAPHRSNRDHATSLGVSDHTVESVRDELVAGAQIAHLDNLTGRDGKRYPAKKPKPPPTILANTPAETAKAQDALRALGDDAPEHAAVHHRDRSPDSPEVPVS